LLLLSIKETSGGVSAKNFLSSLYKKAILNGLITAKIRLPRTFSASMKA
jgi:hypothetical protein